MIAPQSLDRYHVARTDEPSGLHNRIVGYRTAPCIEERQPRPAHRAGHGLGVKAPVRWIMVLAGTVLAHGKHRHGGGGAVVGHVADDGKPRSAIRTVRQGIPIAAVGWLAQFTQAIGARGHVRRDEDVALHAPMAWGDDEPGVSLWRHRVASDPF